MLTDDQKEQYRKTLVGQESKTVPELARELGVSFYRLSVILKELGLSRPKYGRSTGRKNLPRAEFEREVYTGRTMSELCLIFGVSARVVHRHAREFGLILLSKKAASAELAVQGQRFCPSCKEIKSLEKDFYNHHAGPLGKNSRCKECQQRMCKQYQQGYKRPARDASEPLLRQCIKCKQIDLLETAFEPDPTGQRRRSNYCRECLEQKRARAAAKAAINELEDNGLRRCCHCHELKSLELDFHLDVRCRRGRLHHCRECSVKRKSTTTTVQP